MDSMHCIHTLYILTEIFYLPLLDPLLQKTRYSNKDLRYIIASRIIHTNRISDFLKYTRRKLPSVIQEECEGEDGPDNICAICQMEIVKRDATTSCESECMNIFHLECFSQWAKY
jgi:hypothetical protein